MAKPINWKQETDETVKHLVRLVQTNTVNPPGNELPAVLIVKDILEGAGFPPEGLQIIESTTNRANLVARLKGDGSERPFLMSGHLDVVPVEREHWSHDPFGGEIIDNAVWGRGALDMKGFLAMYLQIFLGLFRQKIPLKRDVILAAIADEEAGFIHGSNLLVERYPELINAEYGITEGGAMSIYFGKTRIYPIQVAEKAVCWMRIHATGKSGHGSIPHADNPVFALAAAIEKLHKTKRLPIHLTPAFLKMLDAAGDQSGFPLKQATQMLHWPWLMSLLLRSLRGDSANMLKALVTNTVSPTMLRAGNKVNVIPSEAVADLDCRFLPGQTPESMQREIHRIIGEDIKLETVYSTGGAEFSTDTKFFKLLENRTRQMDPGGLVIPMLMPGATDACQYQKAGIKMYGFTPGILPPGMPILQMVHGNDERMPISYIEAGLPVLWGVATEFCGKGF